MKRTLLISLSLVLVGINTAFAGNAKVLYADAYQLRADIMNRFMVDFKIQLELAGTNQKDDFLYIVLNNERWPENDKEISYFYDSSGKPKINMFEFNLPVVNGKTTYTLSEAVVLDPCLMTGNKNNNTFYYKTIIWNEKTKTYIASKMMQFTPDAKQLEEAMCRAGLSIVGGGIVAMLGGWPSNITTEATIRLYSSPCTDLLSPSIMRRTAEEFLGSQYSNYRNLAAKYGYKDGKINISDQFFSNFSVAKDKFSSKVGIVSFSEVLTNDFSLEDVLKDLAENGYEELCDDRARYTIGDNVYNAFRYVNYKKQYCAEFGYVGDDIISYIFYRYTASYNFIKAAHQLLEANVYNDYHKEISKVWDVTYGKKGKASNGNWLVVQTAPYCNAGTCRAGVIDATGKNMNVTATFFDNFAQMGQYTKDVESQLKSYNYVYQYTKNGYKIYKGKYYAALKYTGSALSSITVYKPVKKPDPKKPGNTIIIVEPPIIMIQSNTTIIAPPTTPVKPESGNNPPRQSAGNTGGHSGTAGAGRHSGGNAGSTVDYSTDDHSVSFDFIEVAEALMSSRYSNCRNLLSQYKIGTCQHKNADGSKRHRSEKDIDKSRDNRINTFKCFGNNSYLNMIVGKARDTDNVRYVSYKDIYKGATESYFGNVGSSLKKAGYTYQGKVKSNYLRHRSKKTGTTEYLTVDNYINKEKNYMVEVYIEDGKGLQNIIFSRTNLKSDKK